MNDLTHLWGISFGAFGITASAGSMHRMVATPRASSTTHGSNQMRRVGDNSPRLDDRKIVNYGLQSNGATVNTNGSQGMIINELANFGPAPVGTHGGPFNGNTASVPDDTVGYYYECMPQCLSQLLVFLNLLCYAGDPAIQRLPRRSSSARDRTP